VADQIHLEQLELSAHIGVPEEEQAEAQRLAVTLTLEPRRGFSRIIKCTYTGHKQNCQNTTSKL